MILFWIRLRESKDTRSKLLFVFPNTTMACYSNNLKYDAVNRQAQESDSNKISSRNFYRPSAVASSDSHAFRRATNDRETISKGGDTMSREFMCADRHTERTALKMAPCRSDSMCQDRRQIKVENNLLDEQVDRFLSSQYHKGYQVPASIPGLHQQSRMVPHDTCVQPSPCNKTSYGTYSTSTLPQYA